MLKTQQKNKLMHFTLSLGTGGLEGIVRELIEGVDPDVFASSVCCISDKGWLYNELKGNGIKVFCMNKKDSLDYSLFFKIADILKKEEISIVHSHDSSTNLYAGIAAKIAGVKNVINTEHGGIYFETGRKKFINRFLCFLNKKIVCVSQSTKNDLIGMGLPVNRLEVIPNGLAFSKFDIKIDRSNKRKELGLCDSDFIICCVGRLSREKNHKMLLDSAKSVLKKIPHAKFLLAGDGPLKEYLKKYASDSMISDKIIFLGSRKDIPEILKISDCFAACSDSESFGLSVLEAMAVGVPVVSTCAGGLKEIVKDGETGILIERNDTAGLVSAICRIKEDTLLREKIVFNAKKMVKDNYKIENMIRKYEELYSNL